MCLLTHFLTQPRMQAAASAAFHGTEILTRQSSHLYPDTSRSMFIDHDRQMAGALEDRRRVHMRTLERALPGRSGICGHTFDEQPVLIDVLLIARIGDRGEQRL